MPVQTDSVEKKIKKLNPEKTCVPLTYNFCRVPLM